jgi:rod shape determining protein RodA
MKDYLLFTAIGVLVIFSFFVLHAIAPYLFPSYFLYYVVGFLAFIFFLQLDFGIISAFSWHFYIGSIIFLLLPLIIGKVTRGTIRWIPIGSLSIQPSEIIRPFLFVFFANYLTTGTMNWQKLVKAGLLFLLPVFLIYIQPSLGVAILTSVGVLGILLATQMKKRYFLFGGLAILVIIPLVYNFLAPYQKGRITLFLSPGEDPYGAGYNSVQTMIAVGSGKLFGRGLGKGVETQLSFLPERQTDFIFASVAEEMGLAGAVILLFLSFFILTRLVRLVEHAKTPAGRAFVTGLFLTLFVQICVHVGMNVGLLPITGVPLPLVSAGGSSFLGTLMGLSIAQGVDKG